MIRIKFFLITVFFSSHLFGQEIIIDPPAKLGPNVNTASEEVLPLLANSQSTLYFVRAFDDENMGGKLSGQDIWYTQKDSTGAWGKALNLSTLNSPLNNVVVGVSANDSTLYLLNTYSGKLRWNYGISYSHKENNGWTKPEELPIKFEYSGQLRGYYITPEANVILASSESKDSYGNEDLFLYRKENDKWIGPFHFNQTINTTGAEISPFLSPDHKILYFASNGHEGLGGFDIYLSERLDDTWENWSPPVNLGPKINSDKFDAYLSTYENGQTFFVSNKEGKKTNIYTTTLKVRLTSQETNKMLDLSALLNDRFREVLTMDTTINSSVSSVATATPEVPHNIDNVLKGNAIMNRRLFGVDERDSLINLYVSEQKNLLSSSNEYTKLNLYNRALSEDINAMVDRNAKTEKTMTGIPVDAGKLGAEAREEHYLIKELKTVISKQIIENAALKQNISEAISQNSFLKHSFTLTFVKEKGAILSRLSSNNASIEEGVNRWIANLEAINQNVSKLIEVTSTLRVYLNRNTEGILAENTLNQKFENTLAIDTTINQRLASLVSEIPELSKNVEKLLVRDSSLNRSLFKTTAGDLQMTQNLLELAGTDRTSPEYQKLSSATTALSQNIANTVSGDTSNIDVSLVKLEENVLARNLPEQIAKNITLKQGISKLIGENVKLKENFIQATDGGDSTTNLLAANNALLKEQLNAWESTIEVLENSTSTLEKAYSPYQYANGVLAKNAAINKRFKEALAMDTTINQDLVRQMSDVPELKSTVVELAASNTTSDYHLFMVSNQDAVINKNITKIASLGNSSEQHSRLVTENAVMGQDIAEAVSHNATITQDITRKVLNLRSQAPSELTASIEQNMASLMLKNATLRQGIAELTNQNVTLKLDLTQSQKSDTATASQMALNTRSVNEKVNEWFSNMETLEQYITDMSDAIFRYRRTREVLAQNNVLNKKINEMIAKDQGVIHATTKASGPVASVRVLALGNTSLNQGLQNINGQELFQNEILIRLISSDSTPERANELAKTVVLADSIQKLADLNDTILNIMARKAPDTLGRNIPALMVKNAMVKQKLTKLLDRNASLKLHFDEKANGFDTATINRLEDGNLAIQQRINEWIVSLKEMDQSFSTAAGPDNTPIVEETTLIEESLLDPNTQVGIYTIQILAMPRDVQPFPSFFDKVNGPEVKMTRGKDGLDRYYIGNYNNLREAREAVKDFRAQGYNDAFIRAIIKYTTLYGPNHEKVVRE